MVLRNWACFHYCPSEWDLATHLNYYMQVSEVLQSTPHASFLCSPESPRTTYAFIWELGVRDLSIAFFLNEKLCLICNIPQFFLELMVWVPMWILEGDVSHSPRSHGNDYAVSLFPYCFVSLPKTYHIRTFQEPLFAVTASFWKVCVFTFLFSYVFETISYPLRKWNTWFS